MSLPAEILEHILDCLKSDIPTLKACSQSHPILSQLAERPLYANVTVHHRVGLNDLREALSNRAHVVNYVHTLEIIFERFTEDQKAFLEEMSSILPKLSKLKRIALTCTSPAAFRWQRLPENFLVAFLECLRLPSLTDVCVDGVPMSLYQLSHIQNLSLRHWFHNQPMVAGDESACPPTIDSLTLYDCWFGSMSSIATCMKSGHVSSLTFSGDHVLHTLPQILHGCSHSLASLDVDIGQEYRTYYDFKMSNIATHPNGTIPIPLPVLPHLQRLTFHGQVECINNKRNTIGTWGLLSPIFAIAEVLKSASSLKRLNLDFYIFIAFHDYQDAQQQITDVLCQPLHSLLVQSASTIDLIDLRANSIQEPDSVTLSPTAILSIFAGCVDLLPFVENGKLTLTPGEAPIPVAKSDRQVRLVAPPPQAPLVLATSSESSNGRTLKVLRNWSKKLIGRSTSK